MTTTQRTAGPGELCPSLFLCQHLAEPCEGCKSRQTNQQPTTTTTTTARHRVTNHEGESVTITTMAGIITADDAADDAAASRVAARRAAWVSNANKLTAADQLARLTARMGDDVAGMAIVETLQRLQRTGDVATTGEVIAKAWADARGHRKDAANKAAADRERVTHFATGRMVTSCESCHGAGKVSDETCEACRGTGRETATGRMARVIAQRGEVIGDAPTMTTTAAPISVARVTRKLTDDDEPTTRHERLHAFNAWAATVAHAPTDTRGAFAAAIKADGPTTRPDHDAAGCNRPACKQCATVRKVTGEQVGSLTRAPRNGSRDVRETRRPARRDAAPREETSARPADLGKGRKSSNGQTRILTEGDLSRMLDATAHHYASEIAHESSAPTFGSDAAMSAAVLATVESVGRRGSLVAWAEWANGHALRTGETPNLSAWRATVAGKVGAWAMSAGIFRDRDIPRMARRANLSAADLAASMSDAINGPTTTARQTARMARRPDARAALNSFGTRERESLWRAMDAVHHANRSMIRQSAADLRAEYAAELASVRATFRDRSARMAARATR